MKNGNLKKGLKDTLLIIIHGYQGSNEDYAIKNLSIELNKKGFPIFSPNLYLKQKKNSEIDIINQVNIVTESINLLKKKYKKIVLIGGSLGGLIAKIVASNSNNINGLVTINGFFYFSGIKKNDLKTAIKLFISFPFNKESRRIILFYYKNLSTRHIKIPTLVITSKSDERINYKQSIRFYNSLMNKKKIVFIKNMDHGLTKKEYIINSTLEITSWLKNLND